jgi:serine/threonine protein kinase
MNETDPPGEPQPPADDAEDLNGAPSPPLPRGGLDDRPRLPRDLDELIGKLERARPGPGLPDPFAPADPFSFVDAIWSFPHRPTRFGRFEVRGELGRGGAGIVLLAIDSTLGRRVALKLPRPEALVDPEARTRFLFGAYAPAMLDHPNLIAVFEIGQVGPIPYIVFSYHPGLNLADWLVRRDTPVPVSLAVEVVADLASGVQHLHDKGFVHRDISPSNILLAPGPGGAGFIPKLLDFDLVLLPGDDRETVPASATYGTPPYLAPEQLRGRHDQIGPRADLYALGAILYELLTGMKPFEGAFGVELERMILRDEPPPPELIRPGLPHGLASLCVQCLAKDPAGRPASARAIRESLLEHRGPSAAL